MVWLKVQSIVGEIQVYQQEMERKVGRMQDKRLSKLEFTVNINQW